MKFYTLRPRARADLSSIWFYSVEQWGLDQADDYVAKIIAEIESALNIRDFVSPDPDLPDGYFRLRAQSHRVICRWVGHEMLVVRVLHARQDIPDDFD